MATEKIVLMDGGMGQELLHRSKVPPSPLWSAQVLMDEPELVCRLHGDFIAAGARVITLNSYSVTPERLARVNAEDQFETLQRRAIVAAHFAREQSRETDIAIAGCLSPLYGSYRPETFPGEVQALATYRRVAEVQAADVDMFLCETMSSVQECVAAVTAASETGLPVWMCVSVNDNGDGLLRSGETIAGAYDAVKLLQPAAVLINCSVPEAVTCAWSNMSGLPCVRGAYANGFTSALNLEADSTVNVLNARTDLSPETYAAHAMGWVWDGARIVGGCCEISPAHIRYLADELQRNGYELCGAV